MIFSCVSIGLHMLQCLKSFHHTVRYKCDASFGHLPYNSSRWPGHYREGGYNHISGYNRSSFHMNKVFEYTSVYGIQLGQSGTSKLDWLHISYKIYCFCQRVKSCKANIHLCERMQSSPMVQPIPITAASTVHLFPIEQWDPTVNGINFVVSFNMWHGCRVDPSPTKVYFWIWTGAKSALMVTPWAMKHLPKGISSDDGIWIVDERLMTFLVEVKMYSSVLNGTSGLYMLENVCGLRIPVTSCCIRRLSDLVYVDRKRFVINDHTDEHVSRYMHDA